VQLPRPDSDGAFGVKGKPFILHPKNSRSAWVVGGIGNRSCTFVFEHPANSRLAASSTSSGLYMERCSADICISYVFISVLVARSRH
jgi:hypothetical protein